MLEEFFHLFSCLGVNKRQLPVFLRPLSPKRLSKGQETTTKSMKVGDTGHHSNNAGTMEASSTERDRNGKQREGGQQEGKARGEIVRGRTAGERGEGELAHTTSGGGGGVATAATRAEEGKRSLLPHQGLVKVKAARDLVGADPAAAVNDVRVAHGMKGCVPCVACAFARPQ